ncbi:MAG TPA: flagellar hook-basal body protein [Chthonomonadaceae bacterium]|nr:flagellar hook-basal body protein [Chthonomonadaceae bacterium]
MERGLYAAATGMIAQQTIQESIAQNLANTNTAGYKADVPTFKAVHGMALRRAADGAAVGAGIGEVGMGVGVDRVYTDWQVGPQAVTSGPLDASLDPGQFFAMETARGTRYTRAGNFQLDSAGNLTNSSGLRVLGADGKPVKIAGSVPPKLQPNGTVTVDGAVVATLQIVDAANGALAKDGDTLFSVTDARGVRPAARPGVHPGTLEQSNVNAVSGMVRLITVSRGFDMAQRAILTQDDLLKHAANDLARV